jgi:hypothetical protein
MIHTVSSLVLVFPLDSKRDVIHYSSREKRLQYITEYGPLKDILASNCANTDGIANLQKLRHAGDYRSVIPQLPQNMFGSAHRAVICWPDTD